jgi:hypothetical protein
MNLGEGEGEEETKRSDNALFLKHYLDHVWKTEKQ